MMARTPAQCSPSLSVWVCPSHDELWDQFVLGDRTELTVDGSKAPHFLGHVPSELGVLVRCLGGSYLRRVRGSIAQDIGGVSVEA